MLAWEPHAFRHGSSQYSFLLNEGDFVFFRGQRHTVVHVEHNLTPPDVSQDIYIRPWQNQ